MSVVLDAPGGFGFVLAEREPLAVLELRLGSGVWPGWAVVEFPPDAGEVSFVLPWEGAPWSSFDLARLSWPDGFELEVELHDTLCWSWDGADSLTLRNLGGVRVS